MARASLVLLPGMDGTGRLFEPLVRALPPDIPVRIVGYPPDRVLSLAEYAALVADRLPPGRCVLLAESFSGLVALTLLARPDPRIAGVIFCAAFAEPPRPLLKGFAPLLGWTAPLARHAPAPLLRHFALGAGASREQLVALRRALAAVRPAVLASRLALIGERRDFVVAHPILPCVYLQASRDRLVPARTIRWFRERFNHCQVERIDGPHFLLQARPIECAAAITRLMHQEAEGARR